MDSAAEDLKDPKGGLDTLLVRSRGQSFFFLFSFLLAYNLRKISSCERIIALVTVREVFLRKRRPQFSFETVFCTGRT